MLTVQTEKTRLESLLESANLIKATGTAGQLTKIKTQIKESREMIAYLKTEPSEEYLISEKDTLETKLKVLEERFNVWNGHWGRSFASENAKKLSFNRMYDVDVLNKRLQFLNRILS